MVDKQSSYFPPLEIPQVSSIIMFLIYALYLCNLSEDCPFKKKKKRQNNFAEQVSRPNSYLLVYVDDPKVKCDKKKKRSTLSIYPGHLQQHNFKSCSTRLQSPLLRGRG